MNDDPCCGACKSSLGTCFSKYSCEHHIRARQQDEADDRARRVVRRPTEDQAIANVMREKRRKKGPR